MMNILKKAIFAAVMLFCVTAAEAAVRVYDAARMGLRPDSQADASAVMQRIIGKISRSAREGDTVVLRFRKGRYDFRESGAAVREYYISNHDQTQPKRVGMALDGIRNLVIEGNGARFVCHGRMLPVALTGGENCRLKDFEIDFDKPHIAQVRVVANDPVRGIEFAPEEWVDWRITDDSVFVHSGEGWTLRPRCGMAFDPDTHRILYRTSDLSTPVHGAYVTERGTVAVPHWRDPRLEAGTVVALRTYERPAPAIFISECRNTVVENVAVRYAEGMGLLAQNSENIELDRFSVALREGDGRYFTTQADATHFSACSGRIYSHDGLYESMMDDAINVHGTYLRITARLDRHTVTARYMHAQSWGFAWGRAGEQVQFIRSRTMDTVGPANTIESITPVGRDSDAGAHEFTIRFAAPLPDDILTAGDDERFGVENLTRTPEVAFVRNAVRNNRARGALFSTPRTVEVADNLFDHTSGSAILLCGDCNGWYETGACRDVSIRRNRFVNALTSLYQFTEAVISIYPEIPDLAGQHGYFHSGIVIEDNLFDTFDAPLLYAKSVDGLIFRRNEVRRNTDFRAYHRNTSRIRLERVTNASID